MSAYEGCNACPHPSMCDTAEGCIERTVRRDEQVLDAIDRWHAQRTSTGELHDFLGWTWDEYGAYVERGELPPAREGAV